MASTEVTYVPPPSKKTGPAKKIESLRKFLWNPARKEFLGRDGWSWGRIGLFYLIFYSGLAGFFAINLSVFIYTLDKDTPRLSGDSSITTNFPGIGFRPIPDIRTTLIRFEQGKPSTYKAYVDHIQATLRDYENDRQESEQFDSCQSTRPRDKICKFLVDDLGEECTYRKDFGYDLGKPCILLKINKLFGWEPEMYTPGSDEASGIQNSTGVSLTEDNVQVYCEGENPADRENIGPIVYYPSAGFHKKYFPFTNQEGYRQPIVMAQFTKPQAGRLIQVVCKLVAKNIPNEERQLDSMHKEGSVHFELLVD
ncbi:sodium/potassium-transporting ATPase subunit beta [Lingula anatina]|uniref:Sodium/potassium-transporting ATPase subunit beta n=1 Tax=Lingula anatina TaxID=7574 RepID=A0A1S3JPS9_LINAN|nr:sodium/potassium-transporting ATPase subunit beta [Lingula anatina]|eukprot:XP_013412380.1 sodium/potassium-transporting ATPase subunit beta [Lingula anatina]